MTPRANNLAFTSGATPFAALLANVGVRGRAGKLATGLPLDRSTPPESFAQRFISASRYGFSGVVGGLGLSALAGCSAKPAEKFDATAVPPELADLIRQAPRPYESSIGENGLGFMGQFLELLQAPGQFLDGALHLINRVGIPLDRPLGDERVWATGLVFGAMLVASNIPIYKEYAKRMSCIGSEHWRSALPYFLLTIPGFYLFIERACVDVLNAMERQGYVTMGDINTQLIFAYFPIWALFAFAWSMVAPLGEKFSGPFMWAIGNLRSGAYNMVSKVADPVLAGMAGLLPMAAVTLSGISATLKQRGQQCNWRGDYLLAGNSFHPATPSNFAVVALSTSDKGIVTAAFTVDAEHLAKYGAGDLAGKLKGARAKITLAECDIDQLVTLENPVQAWAGIKDVEISVSVTHARNLKNEVVDPGAGEIMEGSKIAVPVSPSHPKGVKKLKAPLKVTKNTGPVRVINGTVKKTELIPDYLVNPRAAEKFHDALYDVTVTGPADDLLKRVAEDVINRPVSDAYLPTSPFIPLRLKRWTTLPLMRLMPLPLRRALRTYLLPTPLDIELEHAPGGDVVVLGDIAAQTRFVSRLPENPSVAFSATVADFKLKKRSSLRLRMPLREFEALPDAWRATGGVFRDVTITGNATEFTADGESVMRLATDPLSPLTQAARAGKIRIVLDNPLKPANKVSDFQKAEELALNVPAGSTRTLARYTDEAPTTGFIKAVANLFVNAPLRAMSFGRLGSKISLAVSGGVLSAQIIMIENFGFGYDDPVVIVTSGVRTFFTNGMNRIFGPGIITAVGQANYTVNKFYTPSMFALSLWEIPNKRREANITLYDESLQELGGEDRMDKRLEKSLWLRQLEEDIARVQTGDRVRKAILYKRLANLAWTGVETDRDAELLVEMYEEGRESAGGDFATQFLARVVLDKGMSSSINADEDSARFFTVELEKHGDELARRLAELTGTGTGGKP